MKKLQLVLPILFILVSSISLLASENDVSEKISEYLKNVQQKEVSSFKNLISDDADFIRINKILNKTEAKDKGEFLKCVESGQFCGWASTTNFKVIDFQDNMAVVLVEYENKKLVQKEYLTLTLSDNNWEIVNSVCSFAKK